MDTPPKLESATFHPTLWGDIFLSYVLDEATLSEWSEKHEGLRGEVKKMLSGDHGDHKLPRCTSSKLSLIDAIQRLGVAYHFEDEIEEELASIFTGYHHQIAGDEDHDLPTVALTFRLLREHGFNLTCDVFNKFIDNKGNFKKSLCEDVHGLLSLYEAAYLRVQGEVILDKALMFTTTSLHSLLPQLSPFHANQVRRALYRPLHKTSPRLETRNYFSVYEQTKNHCEILLGFAKLDFNILQKLHQEELSAISKIEASGTAIVDLPDYKKLCYQTLVDVYDEAENELLRQEKSIYGLEFLRESMKRSTRAYFEERNWLDTQHLPTLEEYKSVSYVSCGYPMMSIGWVVFMGDVATMEAFNWMVPIPKMVEASAAICRLMSDIVTHKFEQERVHPPSGVELYMAQYGSSEEEACDAFRGEVEEAWKDMNRAFLRPTPVDKSVLTMVLNLARVIEFLYKESDGYTRVTPVVEESITSLLITAVEY